MDVEWFRGRKRELRVTDQTIADAIGRERSVANRVVNGEVSFDLKYVDGLAKALQVDRTEILHRAGVLGVESLTNVSLDSPNLESNAQPIPMESASRGRPRYDLPVYGTGLGSAREIEGEAIEQTTLNSGEVTLYAKRPALLDGKKDAYGLHVQGSSMHPALPDGEMVAVSPSMPLSIGDNVVVYLRPTNPSEDNGEAARAVLIKELVRRTPSYVELRQYTPPMDFRIPMTEVVRIDRVLSRKDMLS